MTQGYMVMGLDRDGDDSFLKSAYLTALSLKIADPDREVAIMLKEIEDLPEEMEHVFDYAVQLPYDQLLEFWGEPRIFAWQPYYCTPFDETILITQPAIAIDAMEEMWIGLDSVDLAFATAKDFQNNQAEYKTKFVRQEKNNIDKFNADIVFFRKSERAAEFFKMADVIYKEWEEVYEKIVPEKRPPFFDYTLITNTVAYLLGEDYSHIGTGFEYTDFDPDNIDIVHSENDTKIDWAEQLTLWFDQLNIKVNNHRQTGLFVYHDPALITEEARNGISQAYRKTAT